MFPESLFRSSRNTQADEDGIEMIRTHLLQLFGFFVAITKRHCDLSDEERDELILHFISDAAKAELSLKEYLHSTKFEEDVSEYIEVIHEPMKKGFIPC